MAGDYVFLSYIREDKEYVDELQMALEAAGFTVWRDTKDLWPGENWELKIREAIREGSLVFLACFSSALADRKKSYQFAELSIAAEEYRIRPVDSSWLMTVRFDECEIPPIDLGAGRTLDGTIHRLDLFGPQKVAQVARLVAAVGRAIGATPGPPAPAVLQAVADAKRADDTDVARARDLIRNPTLVMDYEEFLEGIRERLLHALADRDRFPIHGASGTSAEDEARAWMSRIQDYDSLLADVIEPMKLLGMYGEPSHRPGITQFMRGVATESTQIVGLDLYRHAHEYPALVLSYVIGLAAYARSNFGMFRAATSDVTVRLPQVIVPFVAYAGNRSVTGGGNWADWVGSLVSHADEGEEITDDLIQALAKHQAPRRYTPISDHLFTLLAPLFESQYFGDEEFAEGFDRVEVMFDAITEDTRSTVKNFYGGRNGYGRYTWRYKHVETPIEQTVLNELEAAGAGWTPLLGGLFGGEFERAKASLTSVVEVAQRIRSSQF
ncbi:toll/interleukin-1 receptor domain-containing protein [Agromyces sp. NPDC057865]|uniref:toll/interleukin-1 receptor domain-containing protein n=1 Tax=Agromyces sp. NPDC057865 TaxID=3346267 RepID=UPI00366E7B39